MNSQALQLTDSHAHLTSPMLVDLNELLARAQAAQVTRICNICTHVDELERGLTLSKTYPWIYNVASTTPHDVATDGEAAFERFAQAARKKEIVAVGETGLDYFYAHSPVPLQKEFFIRYMRLALETSPIVSFTAAMLFLISLLCLMSTFILAREGAYSTVLQGRLKKQMR